MMVRAGSAVDELMEQLFPLLSPGDILIDGGNSNYEDTNRRVELTESKGFFFVGSGVSGGEEGALNGASIMPGGSAAAWPHVKPILQSIAAKASDGTPCCEWVGPAGLRETAAKAYQHGHLQAVYNKPELVKDIYSALYASKLVSYAQGFAVLKKASDIFGWNLNLPSIARMWRGGCIIRSAFLNDIAAAFEAADKPEHLLLAPYFKEEMKKLLPGWKNLVAQSMREELPVPSFSSALNYFFSMVSDKLPANLVQAQRDYFGAHTFERVDNLRGVFFHENWTGHGGDTKSGTYNV